MKIWNSFARSFTHSEGQTMIWTTILYEKELDTMTPNQVLNKVIAHELRNDIKTKAPSSSPTHSALACKQFKKLKKMAIKGSSSDKEKEDARSSSNDDKELMHPNLYKQVKKMNKCLKKINSMGHCDTSGVKIAKARQLA